jgi:methylenetetrahydrofolate dehydrogenase (NADP+)/methenyltetrahydrofolate cyclohydrolase
LPAQPIDGKSIASAIRDRTRRRADALTQRGRHPCLAAILIGDDPGSSMYAESQRKAAGTLGIAYRLEQLPAATPTAQARAAIAKLNADPTVHGILLFQPVPAGIDAAALQDAIAREKDVEGVGAANLGSLMLGRPALSPCTAAAAMACIESTGVDLSGRSAVVVGRSAIVGRPVGALLLAQHATVTTCHSRTRDVPGVCGQAEILIVAVGRPGLIGADHIRAGAIVIDVGTHRVPGPDGQPRTVGDVRTDEAARRAAWITPVPGGVGPVTVAMLWSNVVTAADQSA